MVRGHNGVDKRIYLGKQSRNSVSPVKQRGKFDSFYQKRAFNFTRNNFYIIVFKVPNALIHWKNRRCQCKKIGSSFRDCGIVSY
jgi:hypothetical protein